MTPTRRLWTVPAMLSLLTACHAPAPAPQPLYGHYAGDRAAAVDLYKPDQGAIQAFDPYLAPFVLHAVTDFDAAPQPFGKLYRTPDGTLLVDTTRPVVYFDEQKTAGGRALSFVWASITPANGEPRLCGLRMTLDAGDLPLLYEIHPFNVGRRAAYVTTNRTAEAPHDGLLILGERPEPPSPMAPHIYVDTAEGRITDVRCRCEPTRFSAIREEQLYELLPAADIPPGVPAWPWR